MMQGRKKDGRIIPTIYAQYVRIMIHVLTLKSVGPFSNSFSHFYPSVPSPSYRTRWNAVEGRKKERVSPSDRFQDWDSNGSSCERRKEKLCEQNHRKNLLGVRVSLQISSLSRSLTFIFFILFYLLLS